MEPLKLTFGSFISSNPSGSRQRWKETSTEGICQLSNLGTVGEGECIRYGGFADNIARKQRADGELEFVGGFNVFGVVESLDVRGKAADYARSIAQAFRDAT
jgi:hypothetical protein